MAEMYLSYYKGKKVFITGHTGFKGAWLMTTLHALGAEVTGFALAPEYEGLFTVVEKLGYGKSIIGDIRDKLNLNKAISDLQPDFIFHLAAQPLVRRSYKIPAETFEVNVTGTANLLESVITLPEKCTVIVITTDKVYHNYEQEILYKEDDRLGGYDPYSASKACAELVVSSFRNSFFNPGHYPSHLKSLASARAGNVIGGGDWSADRIIPDIVRSLAAGEVISVRNPAAVRPWQHVLEPISGYLKLGYLSDTDPASYAKAYNFGPDPADHLTVGELVTKAIASWGSGNWRDDSDPAQPHEANLLQLDISRARKELNWQPKFSAADAIQHTIDWYKQPAGTHASFSMKQIENYFAL